MRYLTTSLCFAALALTPSALAQERQGDNPQILNLQDREIDFGKYMISQVVKEKVVIAVFGGSHDFQQQLYNSTRDLSDKNIPVAFALLKDNDDKPETALVALYAAGDLSYSHNWNLSEKDSVRSFMTPVLEYLHDWHYANTNPKVKYHQGYYFFRGLVLTEDEMDEALRMTRRNLQKR